MIRRPEQEPVVPAKRVKPGKAIAETARVRPVKNVKLKPTKSAIEKKVIKKAERQTTPATKPATTRQKSKIESFRITYKRPPGASSSSGGVFGNPDVLRRMMQQRQSGQL